MKQLQENNVGTEKEMQGMEEKDNENEQKLMKLYQFGENTANAKQAEKDQPDLLPLHEIEKKENNNDMMDIEKTNSDNAQQKISGTAVISSSAAAAASTSSSSASLSSSGDSLYAAERARGLGANEGELKSEYVLPASTTTYWWQDKYRPRKPRFFNRVRTGFDWNKYNATHYDHDNPPPKIVQGYTFHIFYPDLIDPTVPPTYRLEADPAGNSDYAVLRFMAGAPYEDIAFKIVNKPWQQDVRRGFRCTFDRGILTLKFVFRRFFYRR